MVRHSDLLWIGEKREYLAWADVNYDKNDPFQDLLVVHRREWEF
jgi:hypothetical protein